MRSGRGMIVNVTSGVGTQSICCFFQFDFFLLLLDFTLPTPGTGTAVLQLDWVQALAESAISAHMTVPGLVMG